MAGKPFYKQLQHSLNSLNACSSFYRYFPRMVAKRLLLVYEFIIHPLIYTEISFRTRKE